MTTSARTAMLILALCLLTACNSNEQSPVTPETHGSFAKINGLAPGAVFCVDLIAGQNTVVGTVCFEEVDLLSPSAEDDHLRVTYTTFGGWEMSGVHFYIGTQLPPKFAPGQFPFVFDTWTVNQTSFTFDIPYAYLTALSGNLYSCYTALAHAVVFNPALGQTETGWGEGTNTGRGWSMWFPLCLEEDDGGEGSGGGDPITETAFAFNANTATCFIPTFSNWGWTNAITAGTIYTFDLIASAGQCDIGNGTDVGDVTLLLVGPTAEVTVTMHPPYTLVTAHLYLGTTTFPQVKQGKNWVPTVAPGQYPFIFDAGPYASPTTFTFNAPPNSTSFIAHAVVGGF